MTSPLQTATAATPASPTDGRPTILHGWGRTAPTLGFLHHVSSRAHAAAALAAPGDRGIIARGLGRAYGDAAQNAGGRVLDMTGLREIGDVDPDTGTVRVAAGASVHELMRRLVPQGWLPAVVPGTAHVTVGGAIACDVHGKNHHLDGSFCHHVRAIDVLTPRDGPRTLTPEADPEEFWATAGGMGLTGIILGATLALRPVETARVRVVTERAANLDDALAKMARDDDAYRYSVAWIDCLARGRHLGRSVLLRGDHAARHELPQDDRAHALASPRRPSVSAPRWAPDGLLRPSVMRAFNAWWFHRAPSEATVRTEPLAGFLHPLDAVRGWNRLYGPRGLIQYQLVVPFGREATLQECLERVARAGAGSFLAVLKRFGEQRGLISFPMPGWTLALDVPASAPGLGELLDDLDERVAEAGGRVYLAKDARLRPELLDAMYPGLARWRDARAELDPDSALRSDLARRLGLT
ncbi:MAG: FAD-binding protein [Solirubrobacteraceae bacterium]